MNCVRLWWATCRSFSARWHSLRKCCKTLIECTHHPLLKTSLWMIVKARRPASMHKWTNECVPVHQTHLSPRMETIRKKAMFSFIWTHARSSMKRVLSSLIRSPWVTFFNQTVWKAVRNCQSYRNLLSLREVVLKLRVTLMWSAWKKQLVFQSWSQQQQMVRLSLCHLLHKRRSLLNSRSSLWTLNSLRITATATKVPHSQTNL